MHSTARRRIFAAPRRTASRPLRLPLPTASGEPIKVTSNDPCCQAPARPITARLNIEGSSSGRRVRRQANLSILRWPSDPCQTSVTAWRLRYQETKKLLRWCWSNRPESLDAPLQGPSGMRGRRMHTRDGDVHPTGPHTGCQPRTMRTRKFSRFPFRTTKSRPSIAWSDVNSSFSSVTRRSLM